MWIIFSLLIVALIVIDLWATHKEASRTTATLMVVLYMAVGLLFGLLVWYHMGGQSAKEYITGFVLEKSLAIDNLFVIYLIFGSLGIPSAQQHRVLIWGVLGAIIMRIVLIVLGAALVNRFHWVLYPMSGFLILVGFRLFRSKEINVLDSAVMRFMKNHLPIAQELHGDKFVVKLEGRHYFTPLFIALVLVEFADLIFAVDSVPAILAITTDVFIVCTSNIFAILGLRALYSVLVHYIQRLRYIKYALAVLLIFIGSKIFIIYIFNLKSFPAGLSLAVVISVLFVGILLSLYASRGDKPNNAIQRNL